MAEKPDYWYCRINCRMCYIAVSPLLPIEVGVTATVLFATHYHELTTLGDELATVANVHVAADESDGDVTFLRTVREGPTDRSYGVHVADLAGVPDPVVDRSRDVLDRLREDEAIDVKGSGGGGDETTQVVFDLDSGQVTEEDRTETGTRLAADGSHDPERGLDAETEAILEDLQEVDVDETPPVELVAKVQEWQEQLEDG